MADDDRERLERRVLVLAPTARDSQLTESLLDRAGVSSLCCVDLNDVCDRLDEGAGAVLLAEEAVILGSGGPLGRLADWLAGQPPWSDLPLLILARRGADSVAVAEAMDELGNVTVLERPTRVAALVSTVRSALRARHRQYQIREHLVRREQNEQLLRQNDAALRDADRRKDEFLAILAHELRNPLAPIRNALQILRMTAPGDSAADQLRAMMDRQVNHLVRLVDDLLEVSRIASGKIALRRERVDAGAVVRAAADTSRPFIESAGHDLQIELPAEPLILDGDPVRLAQVFANLLNNAAKYTDAGGRISVRVRREEDVAVITVTDTGAGIPTPMLPRVFDLFTQVDRHSERAQGGLGIGLTLVKSLVEMHAGTVAAHSDGPGQGSTFVVRLPLAVAVADSTASGEGLPSVSVPPWRVLVVDDNHDAAESLGMLLRLLGADVRVVFNGADALSALPTYRPGIVLLDLGMPGMDGHDVARRIRQLPEFHDIALIALTGWGQDEDRRRSQRAGFDHHLIKPAEITALRSLLASLGDRRPVGSG